MNTPSVSEIQEQYPVFICYHIGNSRDGTPMVAGVCEYCGGVHQHGAPGNGIKTRERHCSGNYFATVGGPNRYTLDLQSGSAPVWLQNALIYPLGDISAAAERMGTGARQLASNLEPVPSRADVLAARYALRRCGDFRGAAIVSVQLGSPSIRKMMRDLNSDFWIHPRGNEIRERILGILRACWLRHGGQERYVSPYRWDAADDQAPGASA